MRPPTLSTRNANACTRLLGRTHVWLFVVSKAQRYLILRETHILPPKITHCHFGTVICTRPVPIELSIYLSWEGRVSTYNQMGNVLARRVRRSMALPRDMDWIEPHWGKWDKSALRRGWNSKAIKTRGNGLFRQTHRRRRRHRHSDYGRGRVLSSSEPKEGIGYTV